MPKLQFHRTWPCGFQESIKLEGWTVTAGVNETDELKPCPLHGLKCSRKAA